MRRLGQLSDDEFEHPVIDKPYQAEFLGDRDNIRRQRILAVLLAHPHQALVECRLPRDRGHNRLVSHHNTALVERRDDFIGDPDVDPALGIALDVRTPDRQRTPAPCLGEIKRLLGPAHRLLNRAGMPECVDRANRRGQGHRAGARRHDFIPDSSKKPLGRDMHVIDRAILQDQSELVAGKPAEQIAAAQPSTNALSDFDDNFVGDLIAEGIVDLRKVIDADQHEREG